MPRKSAPINVIVYYPKTEEGKKELADRVSSVRADVIIQYIKNLNCSNAQKKKIFDQIIDDILNEKPVDKSL